MDVIQDIYIYMYIYISIEYIYISIYIYLYIFSVCIYIYIHTRACQGGTGASPLSSSEALPLQVAPRMDSKHSRQGAPSWLGAYRVG